MPDVPSRLRRELGLRDAVIIGLGSMIGAGVFVVLGPAAAAAGSWLLVGLAIAGGVAYCNATSTASLAAVHPTSGGAYAYGRAELNHFVGFLAGWGFVVGKIASCAAMALTCGAYLHDDWAKPIAVLAVVTLTLVNLAGIRKTAVVTTLIVVIVLSVLTMVVVVGANGPGEVSNLRFSSPNGFRGVLEAGGLLFFAFAGYARIATLGEEVRDPSRTIPRAIAVALGIACIVYVMVAVSALYAVGAETLATSPAPLIAVVDAGSAGWAAPVVTIGAAIASIGVLLSLMAGVSRTGFAMASARDLPRWLAAVDTRRAVPRRAEIAVAAVVIAIVLVADVRGAIGFSAFTVLTYYAIANAAAWRLSPTPRRTTRAVAVLGIIGCATLALTLPVESVVVGAAVLAVGAAGWYLRRGSRREA